MPLGDLTFSMINRKGISLTLELRGYMNISHPGTQISNPGYLKQRIKLNPEAFVDLYQFHNRNFYSDPDAELYTMNGFLVLAADGSDVNIPTTPETIAVYDDQLAFSKMFKKKYGLSPEQYRKKHDDEHTAQ